MKALCWLGKGDQANRGRRYQSPNSGASIPSRVNNAGVGKYTNLLDTDIAADRRLFETNFWGIVNGPRIGVPHLLAACGGTHINVGSEVSDISVPIQGMYSTSNHAVLGFTDALRDDRLPVSVTLIKPAAISTPFPRHAKNNLDRDASLPAPVYAVDLVADQILHAAVDGGREFYVGGGGRLMTFLGRSLPSVIDRIASTMLVGQQLADRPADHSNEGLHSSRGFHSAEGDVHRAVISGPDNQPLWLGPAQSPQSRCCINCWGGHTRLGASRPYRLSLVQLPGETGGCAQDQEKPLSHCTCGVSPESWV